MSTTLLEKIPAKNPESQPAKLTEVTSDDEKDPPSKKQAGFAAQIAEAEGRLKKKPVKLKRGKSGIGFGKSFRRKKKKKRREPKPKDAIAEIVTYLAFMCFFTLSTLRGLNDTDFYYFGHQLKSLLAQMEFNAVHSPSFGKNFEDLATVEEFYQWMQGPLLWSVFSPHTFDGDYDWTGRGGPEGYTLGHGKILGAVRISQVRSIATNCNDRVPTVLSRNFNWTCYGDDDGNLSPAVESR